MSVPMISLGGGVEIPQLGFGVFQIPADEVAGAVNLAFEAGYRHIDTARIYDNEVGVGQAVADSGLAREDVFVTTKVWNDDQGFDSTIAACEASLTRLGMEYVDLYLIHWPTPARDLYLPTWEALIKLREQGKVRAIGVSNFHEAHLKRIVEATGVKPIVNQVELSPYLQQAELREANARYGAVTESWSPLARGGDLLTDQVIAGIAEKHGVTGAQVVLRWHLQIGCIVIPKSVTAARIRANFDVFGFELDDADMTAIAGLEQGMRTGPNPDEFNVA